MTALRLGFVCALFAMLIGCKSSDGSGGNGNGGAGEGGHGGGHGGGMESTTSSGGASSSTSSSSSSSSSMITTSSTGTQMGCPHDVCSVGAPLSPSCDACAANVCAGDAACCDAYWDATCVAEAGFVCQECQGPCSPTTCPDGCCDPMSGVCSHDGCEFYGVPCGGNHPDPMTSTCSECYQGCETCNATSCSACVPDCTNKNCGDPDGCGSRCDGTCGAGEFCSIALGKCSSQCDPSSCPSGCCDDSGACRTGVDDAACGENGAHCEACSGHACIAIAGENAPSPGGACQACDSTTCHTGCCTTDGHCTTPDDTACGAAGAACVDCTVQGSFCQYLEYCADCAPDCDGKACGDSNGCGGTCAGPCAAGSYCVQGLATHPDGCVTCGPDTCSGCCDATGQCQSGSGRSACGSNGMACSDCGAQACNGVFQGDEYVNACGACAINCQPQFPGQMAECISDGCGNLCPGAACPSLPGQPAETCSLGANGFAMCQPQGFLLRRPVRRLLRHARRLRRGQPALHLRSERDRVRQLCLARRDLRRERPALPGLHPAVRRGEFLRRPRRLRRHLQRRRGRAMRDRRVVRRQGDVPLRRREPSALLQCIVSAVLPRRRLGSQQLRRLRARLPHRHRVRRRRVRVSDRLSFLRERDRPRRLHQPGDRPAALRRLQRGVHRHRLRARRLRAMSRGHHHLQRRLRRPSDVTDRLRRLLQRLPERHHLHERRLRLRRRSDCLRRHLHRRRHRPGQLRPVLPRVPRRRRLPRQSMHLPRRRDALRLGLHQPPSRSGELRPVRHHLPRRLVRERHLQLVGDGDVVLGLTRLYE